MLTYIIHFIIGGGGVGKTFLTSIMSQFVEKILRNVGDHPFQPKVLLVAPTGIAASLIGKCYDEITFNHLNHMYVSRTCLCKKIFRPAKITTIQITSLKCSPWGV